MASTSSMINAPVCNHESVVDLRNISAEDISLQYYFSDAEKLLILVFFPFTLAFGLVGNVAFLAVVARIPSMRTTTNAYLAHLAVCDIAFITSMTYDIFIAYLVSPDIKMQPYNSSFGCVSVYGLLYLGHFTSLCLIVVMSFERYMAICRPLQHRMVVSHGRTKKLIIFSWTFGLLWAFIIIPGFGAFSKSCILWPQDVKYNSAPTVLTKCGAVWSFYRPLAFTVQVIPYTFTVLLSVCMYCRIIMTMHTRLSSRTLTSKDQTDALNGQRAETARNQVARLLIATGVVLILSNVPYYVTRMNDALLYMSDGEIGYKLTRDKYGVLLWFVRGFATVNSVINPVIYSATNPRYRKAFLQVFTWATPDDPKIDLTLATQISNCQNVTNI